MKWHTHETSYDTYRRLGGNDLSRDQYYLDKMKYIDHADNGYRNWGYQCCMEYIWEGSKRPFYNVWPAVVDGLVKIDLDVVKCSQIIEAIKPMPRVVNLRFAMNHEYKSPDNVSLMSALVMKAQVSNCDNGRLVNYVRGGENGLMVASYAGERVPVPDVPSADTAVYWTSRLSLTEMDTVGEEISRVSKAHLASLNAAEETIVLAAIKTYMSIALMRNDTDMIEAVVLRRHEEEYAKTKDKSLVAKARSEGVVGWNVGAAVEVCPHYRRAHRAYFAVRWTGPGRAIPRVVRVKGGKKGVIVHRQKLTDVPTGNLEA